MRTVEEQVVEGDPRQVPGPPGLELVLDRLADPAHRRLGQRRLGTEGLGQGRLHVADREPADEAGDDEGLQGVGPAHTHAEQPGGELLVGPPELRSVERDRAGGGLDRRRAVAVAAASVGSLTSDVAVPAQELGDLGLEGRLHQQADAQLGYLFEDLAEVAIGGEQLVDVGADALDGGYSVSTRVWVPFVACQA